MVASLTLMSFRTADERAAEALARRVMGSKAKAVVFEQMDATTDAYELLQRGNKVLIRGNKANSMAVGLNRYIQQYCLANVLRCRPCRLRCRRTLRQPPRAARARWQDQRGSRTRPETRRRHLELRM